MLESEVINFPLQLVLADLIRCVYIDQEVKLVLLCERGKADIKLMNSDDMFNFLQGFRSDCPQVYPVRLMLQIHLLN